MLAIQPQPQKQVQEFRVIDNDLSIDVNPEQLSLEIVNASVVRRRQNNRISLTEALRAGRHLNLLRKYIPHGHWEDYITRNTIYASPQEARVDMRFWEHWQPHINDLVNMGIVNNIDSPEDELVAQMSDSIVTASFAALTEFSNAAAPDFAIDMAVQYMLNQGGTFTRKKANQIIEIAKTIECLPENIQPLAHQLVEQHGVTNIDVIKALPELNETSAIEEVSSSGTIFVPGIDNGDGKQVPINTVSKTDVDLVLGKLRYEELNQDSARIKHNKEYDFVTILEGSVPEIIQSLLRYPQNIPMKISLYRKIN